MYKQLAYLFICMAVGCKTQSSNYCADAPFHNCKNLVDAPLVTSCTDNSACALPTGVCDTAGSKTCVQCTRLDDAACTGATPVCGGSNQCRACEAHSECDSKVCQPDGSCAAVASIAYVDGAAAATNTACTAAAPCNSMSKGLATTKPIVKISGTVIDAAKTVITARTVTLFAEAGAAWTRDTRGPIVEVGANATVEIHGLEITDATNTVGNTDGIGIVMAQGVTGHVLTLTDVKVTRSGTVGILAGGGTLTVKRSSISSSGETGISVGGGTVTVDHSTISNSVGLGISAGGGTLTVARSEIFINAGGGISLTGATFALVNNIIHHNGSIQASIGGVAMNAWPATSRFEFNTVVDNVVSSGTTRAGGVLCDNSAFKLINNIIARNRSDADAAVAHAQINGVCGVQSSTVQPNHAGLNFTSDIPPYDYHLRAGSIAIDKATTTSTVAVDIDGDIRPQGAGKDQGADEYRP